MCEGAQNLEFKRAYVTTGTATKPTGDERKMSTFYSQINVSNSLYFHVKRWSQQVSTNRMPFIFQRTAIFFSLCMSATYDVHMLWTLWILRFIIQDVGQPSPRRIDGHTLISVLLQLLFPYHNVSLAFYPLLARSTHIPAPCNLLISLCLSCIHTSPHNQPPQCIPCPASPGWTSDSQGPG